MRLASQRPTSVIAALSDALRDARTHGLLRKGIDVDLFAERICYAMLYTGTGLFEKQPVERVARALCDVFLNGLAVEVPTDAALDRSDAMRAVREVIETWDEPGDALDDRAARIHAAARSEFGRRGYEVTTVREIAAAAGVSTGAVYRVIGSKEDLLVAITTSFSQKILNGWSAAVGSDATAVEKIDALAWLKINVLDRFMDEFKIQLAWLRQSPPETSMFGWSFQIAVRGLRTVLRDGQAAGDLRAVSVSGDLMARCVLALTWMPENSVRAADRRGALGLARDAVLRGALERR